MSFVSYEFIELKEISEYCCPFPSMISLLYHWFHINRQSYLLAKAEAIFYLIPTR